MRRSILVGSRVAAVAMCVASSAAIAASARAAPSASDRHAAYLLTLEHFGLNLGRDDAFAQGVAVCLVSDQPGETHSDVVRQVIRMHPTWNLSDAQHFVGAAEERYCADKLPQGAHSRVCGPDEQGFTNVTRRSGPAGSATSVQTMHGHQSAALTLDT
jgi:hypothetical protein